MLRSASRRARAQTKLPRGPSPISGGDTRACLRSRSLEVGSRIQVCWAPCSSELWGKGGNPRQLLKYMKNRWRETDSVLTRKGPLFPSDPTLEDTGRHLFIQVLAALRSKVQVGSGKASGAQDARSVALSWEWPRPEQSPRWAASRWAASRTWAGHWSTRGSVPHGRNPQVEWGWSSASKC